MQGIAGCAGSFGGASVRCGGSASLDVSGRRLTQAAVLDEEELCPACLQHPVLWSEAQADDLGLIRFRYQDVRTAMSRLARAPVQQEQVVPDILDLEMDGQAVAAEVGDEAGVEALGAPVVAEGEGHGRQHGQVWSRRFRAWLWFMLGRRSGWF